MLLGVMLASLVMSASIPEAFGDQGLVFAAALVVINVGRTVFALLALDRNRHLRGIFQRVLVWWSATGLLWLAGGLAHEDLRTVIWVVAVAVEYGGVWLGFPTPGLGRSRTTDCTIAGEHMAERCHMLALGESILVTGTNFGELPRTAQIVAAFLVAFVGSAALWWIYFDRSAEAARRVISAASDPGRIGGFSAYTYFHIPMVAGIIAAAGADELTIAHPGDGAMSATTALILGGPALYLVGNALLKWALWDRLPRSRLVAICALIALVPAAVVSSALVLLVAATLVLVAVALWDARTERAKSGSASAGRRW